MRSVLAMFSAVVLLPLLAFAQPLADRVPADAIVYLGWRGIQDPGSGYANSRFKAVLESTQVPQLVSDFLPRLTQKLQEKSPQGAEITSAISTTMARLFRHPSALYFGGVDMANPRQPVPIMTLIVDAGDEAAALQIDLQNVINRAGMGNALPGGAGARAAAAPPLLQVKKDGNVVTLAIGPVTGTGKLSDTPEFKDLLARLQKNPAAAIYVSVPRLVKQIDAMAARAPNAQGNQKWQKLRDALALNKINGFAWTGAFEGPDWISKGFLSAPAPRAGLAAMFDVKPVSDDILKLIPASAVLAGAGTFDAAALLQNLRSGSAQFDPAVAAKFDQSLERIRTMTGVDLQKDLLEPLGDQWAYYTSPAVAGTYSFGLVLVNKPDDAAKVDQALTQLAASANNVIAALMGPHAQVQITFQQTAVGDLKIHYLATPFVRPSWTVKNGVLFVGLYPQTVIAAADITGTGPSILENLAFTAMRTRLGQPRPTGITFVDLPKSAVAMYPQWLVISSYAGMSDLFGVQSPPILLPPLDKLLAQLIPAGSVQWTDNQGFYIAGVSPFPGAKLIGTDASTNIAVPAVMMSILLPSLNRARETANRVKCASNERQIGQAILLFSNDNKGKYPPDLGTLVLTEDITPEVFTCPSSNNAVPPDLMRKPPAERAKWVNENSNYVYLGAGMNNNIGAEAIVLYEKNEDHNEDGMNLLYGDGHVEWQSMPMAQQLIQQAGKK